MGDRVIEFYGTECKHCKEMTPIIEQVQQETGVTVTRIEVWHNSDNAALLRQYDKDDDGNEFCGGVPFFYNEKTGAKICGNTSAEKFKAFVLGQ